MDVLTYDELRVIEREERASNKLHPLSDVFVERFNKYVSDKERVLLKSDDNPIAVKIKERTKRELVNARNSFRNIFELRAKKIYQQVIIDLRMGASPDFEGLTSFEVNFYKSIRSLLSDYFNSLGRGNVKKSNNPSPVNDDNLLVRFVSDLPEFAWGDSSLGPFKAEDIANLPKSVASLLIDKGVVKLVIDDV